jgi:shikimate kinase
MYAVRRPLYARFADFSVENTGTPEETVDAIMEVLK